MAIVYYPKKDLMLRRDTVSASYEQIVLSTTPNTILYFGSGSELDVLSASTFYLTASWANTASCLVGTIESASYSLTAVSASYAPSSPSISASYAVTSSYSARTLSASYAPSSPSISASYAQTADYLNQISSSTNGVLTLGSNIMPQVGKDIAIGRVDNPLLEIFTADLTVQQNFYIDVIDANLQSTIVFTSPIEATVIGTASVATSASSATYAISASYALNGGTPLISGSTYQITSSWARSASFWDSSSVVSLIGTKQNTIGTGSLLPITASVAISASYAPGNPSISASYSTTSSYSIAALSASYAPGNPSISASYALTASYALNGGGSGTSLTTGSAYPITSSWSTSSISSSYSLSSSYAANMVNFVPYTGSINDVNLGTHSITASNTLFVSSVAPSNPKNGTMWWDTEDSASNTVISSSYALAAGVATTSNFLTQISSSANGNLTVGNSLIPANGKNISMGSISEALTEIYTADCIVNTVLYVDIVQANTQPNIVFSNDIEGTLIGTASVALTSSYISTASYADRSLSASYAPGNPSISASYATTSSVAISASYAPGNPSISASYALISDYLNQISGSTTASLILGNSIMPQVGKDIAIGSVSTQLLEVFTQDLTIGAGLFVDVLNSNQQAVITLGDDLQGNLIGTASVALTASYLLGSIVSSSYAISASYAPGGTGVTNGGSYNISTSFASSSISASYVPGVYSTEYIYIPATAMVSDGTNGPSLFFYETSSGYTNIASYAFDSSTDENVTALLRLPPYWNYTTPLKAKLVGFINSGSNQPFVMGIKARGMSVGNSTTTGSFISGSYGTEVSTSIVSRAAVTLCEWDSVLTFVPSDVVSANDMISIKIGRKTTDVSDIYGADVYFVGLTLEFIKTTGSWSMF